MSGDLLPLLAITLLVALLVWGWLTTRRPTWAPQGPPLMPWLGNILNFDPKNVPVMYNRWSKTYGGIYHVKLGRIHLVVLSDPDLVREAYSQNELTGRPDTELCRFFVKGQGLGCSQGQLWHDSRRLTLHHLRNFGMGKSSMESYMHRQITSFMDQVLAPSCGKAIAIDNTLNAAVANIIWKMVASEELDITDKRIHVLCESMMGSIKFAARLVILDAFPWLAAILPDSVFSRAKKEKEYIEIMQEAFTPTLKHHRQTLDLDAEPRDYIEVLLQEQHHHPERMPDWHLLMCLRDLFIAGSDTTSTALRWALAFLCDRPECQSQLQAELDAEVGRHRLPSATDRTRMPYTEAVILETHRLASISPTLLPHQTLAPATIGGHRLPAGVQVVGDVCTIHHNGDLFPDPLQFRPERFLDAEGQFRPDKNVMPFSVGKRLCMGEPMARAELFLFLTTFLQKFSFRWPEGEKYDLADNPEGSTIIRAPAPYKIVPQKR